ncbi:hypothetical protein ACFE04_029359 [Oxalis oulophora]
MGCSASTLNTTIEEDLPIPLSSSSSTTTVNSLHSSPKPNSNKHHHNVHRALSLQTPLVHHPPSKKGDTHHLVSLTSTTYGSLYHQNHYINIHNDDDDDDSESYVIVNNTPENPCENLSPDSVINTWELMDGLDDDDVSLDHEKGKSSIAKNPNFDCHIKSPIVKSYSFDCDTLLSVETKGLNLVEDSNSMVKTKPLWKHLSEESFLSNLDPNVVSSYRHAISSRLLGSDKSGSSRSLGCSPMNNASLLRSPCTDNRIVLYFTSLRGIRKTYEDCCEVRMIFRGCRVQVDERDISMDSSYRKELQSLLGVKAISLPQVFIRGKHIGGVEEIKQMNEVGELAKLLSGFPVCDPRIVCEHCGDARFVPCPDCSGSRKIFEEEEGRMRRCVDCNENGLIRCPGCCS